MNDKSKIFNEPVDVFIAAAGADVSNLGSWLELGYQAEGETRVFVTDSKDINLKGRDYNIANKYVFTTNALETGKPLLADLEAFRLVDVDILLRSRLDFATAYLLKKFGLIISPDFKYSLRSPKKFKLRAMRTARRFSDVWVQGNVIHGFTKKQVDFYGGIHFEGSRL